VPQSLTGRLVLLLLLALLVSQLAAALLLSDEREAAVRLVQRENVLLRTVAVVRLLQESPPELQQRIVEAASGGRLLLWLADRPAVQAADTGRLRLSQRLADELGVPAEDVRLANLPAPPRRMEQPGPGWRGRFGPPELRLSVRVGGELWLNADTTPPPPPPRWAWPLLVSLGLAAAATAGAGALAVRHMTRPLGQLAGAADAMGRGDMAAPLPAGGPREVRATTEAFARMRERLARYVEDRTRMLAAISHDLRTPITALRLRAEMLEDAETREKMLATLEEMQKMTEATLAFAREEARAEQTRPVDLAALMETIAEDLAEIGLDVEAAEAERLTVVCRPVALRRALRNLVENACAYGDRARLSLRRAGGHVELLVDDDGPGIPEERMEEVFQPFVRLEASRNRATGGIGLGLSIARSIARSHGGDVLLANRPEGGLRATLQLPADAA